jgi:hypothetical protein
MFLFVGIIANMPAKLITRFKDITSDGAILEVVVWKVPAPVPPTEHGYKYSAEMPYSFTGTDQLIEDFIAAVAARRAS